MIPYAGHTSLSATGVVKAGAGALTSITLTAGGDVATITLHDNATTGSGVVMCVVTVGANTTKVVDYALPLAFSNGLYATITGTTPDVSVGYL